MSALKHRAQVGFAGHTVEAHSHERDGEMEQMWDISIPFIELACQHRLQASSPGGTYTEMSHRPLHS